MELLTDKVIYHVETQEDYDDLMERLEKLGYKWGGNRAATNLRDIWAVFKDESHIRLYPDKTLNCIDSHSATTYLSEYKIIKYKKEQSMKVKLKVDQRFIADWYEESKDDFDNNLCTLIGFYFNNDVYRNYYDLYRWMLDEDTDDCIQTLVKIHLFGYEIEPLYYVAIPNPNSAAEVKDYHLAKTTDGRVVIQKRNTTELKDNWKLTESEIKQDFAWAWTFAKKIN